LRCAFFGSPGGGPMLGLVDLFNEFRDLFAQWPGVGLQASAQYLNQVGAIQEIYRLRVRA
jgi:hypothetical protein